MNDEKPDSAVPSTLDTDRPARRSVGRPRGTSASPARRLSLPLDSKGRVEVDRLRGETRAEWTAVLPQLQRELLPDDPAARVPLPPWLSVALTQALSQIFVLGIARVTGAPHELVIAHASLTDDDASKIAPALDAVLAKRGGSFLAKWSEELALGVILLGTAQAKASAVSRAWAIETERTRREVNRPLADVDWSQARAATADVMRRDGATESGE